LYNFNRVCYHLTIIDLIYLKSCKNMALLRSICLPKYGRFDQRLLKQCFVVRIFQIFQRKIVKLYYTGTLEHCFLLSQHSTFFVTVFSFQFFAPQPFLLSRYRGCSINQPYSSFEMYTQQWRKKKKKKNETKNIEPCGGKFTQVTDAMLEKSREWLKEQKEEQREE
jgi:hypothetical protein